jgi:hypothetical protein
MHAATCVNSLAGESCSGNDGTDEIAGLRTLTSLKSNPTRHKVINWE